MDRLEDEAEISRLIATYGPLADAGWWDNLLDTYRRFESDEVPDAPLRLRYRGTELGTRSNQEGYWHECFDSSSAMSDPLWDNAIATLEDGTTGHGLVPSGASTGQHVHGLLHLNGVA